MHGRVTSDIRGKYNVNDEMRDNMVKVFWIHVRNFIFFFCFFVLFCFFVFFFSEKVAQFTSENRALKTQRKKLLEEVKAAKVTKRETVSNRRMPEGKFLLVRLYPVGEYRKISTKEIEQN